MNQKTRYKSFLFPFFCVKKTVHSYSYAKFFCLDKEKYNLISLSGGLLHNWYSYPTKDPLLNLADYFCWTIQRVFERGETRYYNFLKDQVKLVVDLYDTKNYGNWKNYYDNKKNPLTSKNRISPLKH